MLTRSPLDPLPAPVRTATGWRWVPIRSLATRHCDRIATHLLSLSGLDRYLRFGYAATDEQIGRYVAALDFARDELFGIFNRRLELIAMTHLAYPPAQRVERSDRHSPTNLSSDPASGNTGQPAMAEFGVSVLARVRGRGFGGRLFAHAVLHARNRGMQTMFIHALSENTVMLKIARAAGATVERDGSESEAWLKLPPRTLATHMGELMEDQAAEIDYRLKQQALRVNAFWDHWADAAAAPAAVRPADSTHG